MTIFRKQKFAYILYTSPPNHLPHPNKEFCFIWNVTWQYFKRHAYHTLNTTLYIYPYPAVGHNDSTTLYLHSSNRVHKIINYSLQYVVLNIMYNLVCYLNKKEQNTQSLPLPLTRAPSKFSIVHISYLYLSYPKTSSLFLKCFRRNILLDRHSSHTGTYCWLLLLVKANKYVHVNMSILHCISKKLLIERKEIRQEFKINLISNISVLINIYIYYE